MTGARLVPRETRTRVRRLAALVSSIVLALLAVLASTAPRALAQAPAASAKAGPPGAPAAKPGAPAPASAAAKPDAAKDPKKDEKPAPEAAKAEPAKDDAKAEAAPAKPAAKPAADDEEDEVEVAAYSLIGRAEVGGYLDDQSVEVLTPAVTVGAESVTDGWGLQGSFLVDIVTAASADIVATASPRWTETRYVPGVNGHKRWDDVDVQLGGGVSIEPDYLAISAAAGVSVDLRDKTITPSFRYAFGYDVSGRAGTPFSVFSYKIHRHGLTAATTIVLDKATILVPTFDTVLEFGNTSKPYRYLPTFTEAVAGTIANGASVDEVNQRRTQVRLNEVVPDTRQRYAGSTLFARRFDGFTLRAEERLYIDSWGVMATTTDATLPIDLGDYVRIWPHARFHAQKGADFWERAYVVTPTAAGLEAPTLRAGDRELGPMLGLTGGGGVRFGGDTMGLTLQADAFYSMFLDHLYAADRLAGFGGITYELVVE
jgi:hypothetical protein